MSWPVERSMVRMLSWLALSTVAIMLIVKMSDGDQWASQQASA
jgi:hypothetical protein